MQYDRPMGKSLSINPRPVLLLIFLFSLAIRLIGLGEKQLWVDEIIQAVHSTSDSIGIERSRPGAERRPYPLFLFP
jgi:hypothetical protein